MSMLEQHKWWMLRHGKGRPIGRKDTRAENELMAIGCERADFINVVKERLGLATSSRPVYTIWVS